MDEWINEYVYFLSIDYCFLNNVLYLKFGRELFIELNIYNKFIVGVI